MNAASACGDQKKTWDPQELESCVAMSHLTWVLSIQVRSPAGAVRALNH